MGGEAWVTSAMEEHEVAKALMLAGSLRRVLSAKVLVVLTTFAVSSKRRKRLEDTFDLVIPLEQDVPTGLNQEDYAKFKAFSLAAFKKCVYLSPNTLVLRNCDEIFSKYGSFAAWGNENGVDSSVYLFSPSRELNESLGNIMQSVDAEGMEGGACHGLTVKGTRFGNCFNRWLQNNIPNLERLERKYNFGLNLKKGTSASLSSTIVIANFGEAHPLDLAPEGDFGLLGELGLIEKAAVQLCKKIFVEDIDIKGKTTSVRSNTFTTYAKEPIAIVGMSFRLPGSNKVEELWELLVNGKEAIRPPPDFRWTREHTYVPCQNRKVEAGFLSDPIDEFDWKFFGISGHEAEFMDPQQRLLHEVAWEALEDAMIDPASIRGSKTGIFVGSWLQDYKDMVSVSSDLDFFRVYLGNSIGAGAARLSHFFETTGPSIATESGCSSAMVAVDMACKSLRSRDSTLALAGGVNLLLHPFDSKNISFVFSPEGRCRTFDTEANGFGRAEGCAVLVLKRLGDAIRDGDNIWGLIRGSAITQEGVSKSIGTPTIHCESMAMDLALEDAQVDPWEVSYVEAHGTGTPVGDPLEIAAIAKSYSGRRSEPLLIGSVKTNLGHTESVAGLAGLIKVLLSFKNEKIPPHLNLKTLNPEINLEQIPAQIPVEVVAWPRRIEKARLAGISSFGITGSNTHVIVQEPPNRDTKEMHASDVRPLHIMKFSAKSSESFDKLLATYEQMFESANEKEDEFANLAYSANIGRANLNHRAIIIAKDFEEAVKSLKSKTFLQANIQSGGGGQLCFLFTGQGSQYPNMGATLYATSTIFRDEFNKCDLILRERYDISLKEVLWREPCNEDELNRTLYSQTSIFCIEYCLLKLWESWGVKPDYVMGHSLGEFAAAVAVGALDFEDGLMLVAERSRLIDNLPPGKMLVIRANKETVDKNIETFRKTNPDFWVDYAALNSPDQTVVAGDSIMIEKFAKYCEENSLKTTILAATHAFHSRLMEPMLEAYRKIAQRVKPSQVTEDTPKYISGMEGKLLDPASIESDYWVRHTREPVNFIDACKAVQSEGCSLLLEIGPHPVLSALTMLNLEGQSITCIPSIRRKESEWLTILNGLGKLYLSGWKGEVDWKGFDRYYQRTRVRVPFYPFNRKSVWTEPESMLPTVHPLLGKPIRTECDHTIFDNRLTPKNPSYTKDHVLGNTVVFPGAGFLEMCLAGGCAATHGISLSGGIRKPQRPVALKSLRITAPLALHDSRFCRLQTTTKLDLEDKDDIGYSVTVRRYIPSSTEVIGDWNTHATAKYYPVPTATVHEHSSPVDIGSLKSSWEEIKNLDFYDRLREVGLRFGPKFQSLESGWKGEEDMLVAVKVPEEEYDHDKYLIHPIVADAMIQATLLWEMKDTTTANKPKLKVPIQIGEFVWLQASTSLDRYIYCATNENGKIQSILLDGQGNKLALLKDVECIETSVKLIEELIQQQGTAMPMLWKEVWKSAPGPLQSSYDLGVTRGTPLLQFNDEQNVAVAAVNDVGEYERSFYNSRCELTRLYFLKAMYEVGWEPNEATPFSLDELMKLLPKSKDHIRKYVNFFLKSLVEVGMLVADDNEVENVYHFVAQPPTQLQIEDNLRTVVRPEDTSRAEYRIIAQVGSCLAQVLLGEKDPLPLIFHDDPSKVTVHQFYEAVSSWVKPIVNELMDVLFTPLIDKAYQETTKAGSSKPILRILEVGAGTGINSQCFLEYLDVQGKPFEYYYTDVSASFFIGAEKSFEKYLKHIVFKKLDMEEDPLAQGFCPNYFDVIVACEVLHVSKDIRKTLRNLKLLAKPGATFSIVETTQPDFGVAMTFGLLEGYWRFEDLDLRPHLAIMTKEKWEQALEEINCEAMSCLPVYNDLHTYIAARFSFQENEKLTPVEKHRFSWLIFYHSSTAELMELLKKELAKVNRIAHAIQRPDVTSTEESMKEFMKSEFTSAQTEDVKLEGVIYLWGLSNDATSRDQSQISLPLINLAQEMVECKHIPRLFVVTQGIANVDEFEVSSPTSATLHGIIKSLSNESTELHLRCLDISPRTSPENQVQEIFYDLWHMEKGNRSVAFRDNNRYFAKFISAKVNHHEPLTLPSGCDRFQLLLPDTKMISDLEFGVLGNYILKENEIEVQIVASGLNFADVFTVLKPAKVFEDFNSIAMDFSGVVIKVGANVTLRKVGDRVSGLNLKNKTSMPSHFVTDEDAVVPIPASMTFAEAVTLPLVSTTAIYCLIELAKIRKGDTVLIHTASGGVGRVAIQLAKAAGATITATAGSKRKQKYLRNLGIEHVFHSRNTNFGKQILEVTNNRGVDIILNSLTGEGFKEASLSALTRNGRFIEMSKLNVWTPEEVHELRPDVFYKIAEFKHFQKSDFLRLLGQFEELVARNSIRPIAYERFDAVNIRGALHYMQRAKHIGKIVCMMPEIKIEHSKITAVTPLFNEYSTYIVTGGLGGIGFALVKWMLNSGAKHMAIVSRSAAKPEIASQIDKWNKSGKHVEAFALDVGDYDKCRELFHELKLPSRDFPAIRGVMHAAGVLADAIMENQTWSSFEHTYNAKVKGTWNLHDLTKDLLLEHFVIFSSMTALVGTPGQTNHAASNSFEDSLVAYRRSIGVPGTTVNWGTWGEVGVATEVNLPGFRPITTSQGILALETFLKTQMSHICVCNMESFAVATKLLPNLKHYVEDKKLFGEIKATIIINADEFWKEVDNAEDRDCKVSIFKTLIKSILRNILKIGQDEDIDDLTEFQAIGIDSLMTLEMKNGLQNILCSRMTLTAAQLKDCNHTEALATRLVDILEGDADLHKPVLPTMEELEELVKEDTILPEHIRPVEEALPATDLSQVRSVLLLGATGVLGPYLLMELSRRPGINKIYCLIRKGGKLSSTERLLNRLKIMDLDKQVDMSKVECIQGDIGDPQFGLSPEEYNSLASEVDAVINSAVRSDHLEKYHKAPETQNMRTVNVKGTVHVLEFAVHTKLKHVYHASTLVAVFTFNDAGNNTVRVSEDWQDPDILKHVPYNTGYPLSKHIAEQLCRQGVDRGIPCKAFRFPVIAGDSETGRCDYLTNHVILRWLTFMKLRCMPDVGAPFLAIPVDHCARLSLDIFFNLGAQSDVFNFMHPGSSVDQCIIGIAEAELGITIKPVSMPEFLEKLSQEKDDSPLAPFKHLYQEEANEGSLFVMGYLGGAKDSPNLFKSLKLSRLMPNYDELEATEVVVRRDIIFLKGTGVLDKLGIK